MGGVSSGNLDTLNGLTARDQQRRRNTRDLLLPFPAPIDSLTDMIVIRVLNGQTKKRLSIPYKSSLFFATK